MTARGGSTVSGNTAQLFTFPLSPGARSRGAARARRRHARAVAVAADQGRLDPGQVPAHLLEPRMDRQGAAEAARRGAELAERGVAEPLARQRAEVMRVQPHDLLAV